MYLVMVLSHNRVNHIKAFDAWDLATMHADELVKDLKGVYCTLPKWENGPYQNVFEWHGIAIVIEPIDVPIRNRGEIHVARAYADADRMRKEREGV